MKSKIIVDCERDVKGLHKFEQIGYDSEIPVVWCSKCGAVAYEKGLDGFTVFKRVQEK